jgi:uncharacterized protein (DUF433 family)
MLCWPKRNDIECKRLAMSETQPKEAASPHRCGATPCLRGLRVRVNDVLDLLEASSSREQSLKGYPLLEAANITAALEYAARQPDGPVLVVRDFASGNPGRSGSSSANFYAPGSLATP